MRVCGKLETLVSMRLQPEGMPDPDDGGLGKPKLLGHQSRAPMRGVFGFLMKCCVLDGSRPEGSLVPADSIRPVVVGVPFRVLLLDLNSVLAPKEDAFSEIIIQSTSNS